MNRQLRATLGATLVASTFVFGACSSSTTEDDGTDTETTVADEGTEDTEAEE